MMNKTHVASIALAVLAFAACGAPAVMAQDAEEPAPTEAVDPVEGDEEAEAENFRAVCSIAGRDLEAGVSIYVDEGWAVVNCAPYVNPNPTGPAPIIGHCCYLLR